MAKIEVKGTEIAVYSQGDMDFISLTDMLRAKDGDFFIADWLRNRNTVEFLGIWEQVHNPAFNYGGFATIRSQAGLSGNSKRPFHSPKHTAGRTAENLEPNSHTPDATVAGRQKPSAIGGA